MMQTRNHISPGDRLGMTLVLALGLHVLIILGVSFNMEDSVKPRLASTTLDVTIIHTQSDEKNPDAQFLAQNNQRGGGQEKESTLPKSPNYNPMPLPEYGEDLTSRNQTVPNTQATPPQADYLTAPKSPIQLTLIPNPNTLDYQLNGMSEELDRLRMELNSTNAEINRIQSRLAQKKREKYASADTREAVDAAYKVAVRDRIESIGTLNFPAEATRRHLTGNVYVDVVIRPDGSIEDVYILRSSGHKVLDDAALQIARFAEPYPPFPEAMKETTSLYHFDQVWYFENGKIFSGR